MDQSTTSRRTVLYATGVVLSGMALAGCTSSESDGSAAEGDGPDTTTTTEEDTEEPTAIETATETETTTEQAETTLADDEWVSIVSHEWVEWDEYSEGVEVVVQNNRDVALDIFVTAKFYDKEDVQIGDATRSSSDVTPDSKARQELAWTGDEKPEDYELRWEAYEV